MITLIKRFGWIPLTICLYKGGDAIYRYKYLEPYKFTGSQWNKDPGQKLYAIVTGGSSGLGRGYAEGLARRGLNLVLIGRDTGKLN